MLERGLMESWKDWASVIWYSSVVAAGAAVVLALTSYGLLRGYHRLRPSEQSHKRADLNSSFWAAGITFTLVLLPAFLAGVALSTMCGTSKASESLSPDGKHKVSSTPLTVAQLRISRWRCPSYVQPRNCLSIASANRSFPDTTTIPTDQPLQYSGQTPITLRCKSKVQRPA